MFSNQQGQIPLSMSFFSFPGSQPKDPSKENLPSWTKFQIRRFGNSVRYSAGVIMDHYLVFLAHDNSLHPSDRDQGDDYESDEDEPATLFAFNLLDHSIQQAEIESSDFGYQDGYYRFLKYGENQIIKYGGRSSEYSPCSFGLVSEYIAFQVRYEKINDETKGRFSNCTAQIYKDYFCVYGRTKGIWGREPSRNEFWSFDLNNRTWKLYEMSGEVPEFELRSELDYGPASFIFQDNFYIYGLEKNRTACGDLFMLDLNSMKWTKIQQQEKYLEAHDYKQRARFGGTIYQDHLVTLKQAITSIENTLCFFNLNTKNTWLTFDIQGTNDYDAVSYAITGDLMIYKNSLISLATTQSGKNLNVIMMSIKSIMKRAPKSAEEEKLSDLFMSQTDSDVMFKVEDDLIPAHKYVLMKKSRYFEGLFKSGMAESKQDVIEINDCKAGAFKEYLRWISQGTIHLDSVDQTMKLYPLADKYLQEDLVEKCLSFLIENMKMNNIYEILDFAHQENVFQLKIWCLKFLKDNINVNNVAGLIEYLGKQEDHEESKENNKEFRDLAFNFVLENFWNIQRSQMHFDESFLIKNIEMETIPALARFLHPPHEYVGDYKIIFENCTRNLKEAVFSFVQESMQTIMTSKIGKEFPNTFLTEFTLYLAIQITKPSQEGDKKRMEPNQNNFDGENHELKKTKK